MANFNNILTRWYLGLSISDTKKSFFTQDHYCMSYHDPRSITWSWIINWTPPWRAKNRTNMTKWYHKLFGSFSHHTQTKMLK